MSITTLRRFVIDEGTDAEVAFLIDPELFKRYEEAGLGVELERNALEVAASMYYADRIRVDGEECLQADLQDVEIPQGAAEGLPARLQMIRHGKTGQLILGTDEE
ncbi:MAG: hypothetical protein U0136_19875 [Bdellovibrionota bacterium]